MHALCLIREGVFNEFLVEFKDAAPISKDVRRKI
jgi:hypothetical protein